MLLSNTYIFVHVYSTRAYVTHTRVTTSHARTHTHSLLLYNIHRPAGPLRPTSNNRVRVQPRTDIARTRARTERGSSQRIPRRHYYTPRFAQRINQLSGSRSGFILILSEVCNSCMTLSCSRSVGKADRISMLRVRSGLFLNNTTF